MTTIGRLEVVRGDLGHMRWRAADAPPVADGAVGFGLERASPTASSRCFD